MNYDFCDSKIDKISTVKNLTIYLLNRNKEQIWIYLEDSVFYSDEYEEKLKKLIFDVKNDIEDGDFHFTNEDEKMCGWCDIKFICHEGVLENKKWWIK